MIVAASKYSDVRAAAGSPLPPASRSRPRPHVASPAPSASPRRTAPAILIPKHHARARGFPEWFERELREGGRLHEYLRAEKVMTERRWRRVRALYDRYRQNNRSDWRLIAAIPGRDFHRWQKVDPNFWDDNANLRSLRRDNPDMPIFV